MIIDACMYFNEAELFAGRVETLNDVVDRFVVVEGQRTHQGERRLPAFDLDRWSAELGDRLTYHVCLLPALPHGDRGGVGSMNYQRLEREQRDATVIPLADANPDDVFCLSDVDEIPSADAVDLAAEMVRSGEHGVGISTYMDCYAVGWRYPARWLGTTVASVATMRGHLTPSRLRDLRGSGELAEIEDDVVGHLTWLGGVAASVEKQQAFSHAELNWRTADDFAEKLTKGIDSNGVPLKAVALGPEYHRFVREGRLPPEFYREGCWPGWTPGYRMAR